MDEIASYYGRKNHTFLMFLFTIFRESQYNLELIL